jgi:alkylated DNA repair dioxygenase AlkB
LIDDMLSYHEHIEIPGLLVALEYLSQEDHDKLLEIVKSLPWPATHHPSSDDTIGKANPLTRKALHYGYTFDYKTMGVDHGIPFKPYPPWLRDTFPLGKRDLFLQILDSAASYCRLDEEYREPDQVTIQFYPPGSGIPPHCDTHSTYTHLYGLSLGNPVTMDFRQPRPDGRFQVPVDLPP